MVLNHAPKQVIHIDHLYIYRVRVYVCRWPHSHKRCMRGHFLILHVTFFFLFLFVCLFHVLKKVTNHLLLTKKLFSLYSAYVAMNMNIVITVFKPSFSLFFTKKTCFHWPTRNLMRRKISYLIKFPFFFFSVDLILIFF